MYTIGSCTSGGMGIVETSLRNFLATLPGVVGSTVQVQARAVMQGMPVTSAVVAQSLQKSQKYIQQQQQQQQPGEVAAMFLFKTPRLPPAINVSGHMRAVGCMGWALYNSNWLEGKGFGVLKDVFGGGGGRERGRQRQAASRGRQWGRQKGGGSKLLDSCCEWLGALTEGAGGGFGVGSA
jgi:hypothetical protein